MTDMAVTKQGEELYLVYKVKTNVQVFTGELDLKPITKTPKDSYSPQLISMDVLAVPHCQ